MLVAGHPVGVTAVHPGGIKTAIARNARVSAKEDKEQTAHLFDEKLARITEPHPWYTEEGAAGSPWGRAIVPFEMISVLANKGRVDWPVRSPSLGLFLDLEVALRRPVFVDQPYVLERELVGLSQSRRTESYWTRTTITDADTGELTATVLLHSGVFKESYPGYPRDRLT